MARESLRTMAGARGTASRAEVGMTQLRVPVRKGKGEEDSVGGTWRDDMDDESSKSFVHMCACCNPPLTTTWVPTWCLRDDYHVAREPDVTGRPTFKWDGGALEVAEHVQHRGEAQMLYPALPALCERQAEVLWKGTEVSLLPRLHLPALVHQFLPLPWLCPVS